LLIVGPEPFEMLPLLGCGREGGGARILSTLKSYVCVYYSSPAWFDRWLMRNGGGEGQQRTVAQ